LAIVPISQSLITGYDWVVALLVLSVLAGLIVPIAFSMTAAITPETGKDTQMRLGEALREAAGHRGYLLLSLGFFVCGFHVAFITIHLPAYLVDQGISPALGATALMLIALFNMIGSWTSGWLAGKISKKYLLSTIYIVRSLIILSFVVLPIGPVTVLVFSAALGFVWLSTVPPTSGLVAQIFGVRYMGVLFGIVYLSHQVGSFTGVWLGGRIFDATGNYDLIWWSAIALGLLSALLHAPINDRPVKRLAEAAG
jgi:predicted MFS family arabinose efflux permease